MVGAIMDYHYTTVLKYYIVNTYAKEKEALEKERLKRERAAERYRQQSMLHLDNENDGSVAGSANPVISSN